jgi:hypothetical protein
MPHAVFMKRKYPHYYYKQVYDLFLDKTPKVRFLKKPSLLKDEEFLELQNFIGCHQKVIVWSTSIDVIEAAWALVEGALENQNIGPEGLIEEDGI